MSQVRDPEFGERVEAELAHFEDRLIAAAQADSPFVTDASQHIVKAGGKRIRPLLVFLSAHATSNSLDLDAVEKAAVVVELTHVASLYHDDVMDEAQTRRGVASANQLFGNNLSILVGDYQFSRASSIVAELGPEFVKLQADTFAQLVQGQIAEFIGGGDTDPMEHYLSVIAGKTASLISTSAMFGGMVAQAQPNEIEALRQYGFELGMLFQLSDDVIDITSDATGKTPGTDLREGVLTLPTLMLQRSTRDDDIELMKFITDGLDTDEKVSQALHALRVHPVIDQAREELRDRASRATRFLDPIAPSSAKDALIDLCDHVITRDR